MNFHTIEPRTGDIIGFQGHGPLAKLIQDATGSRWTHVGQVLIVDGRPCFGESSSDEGDDIFDTGHGYKFGVQVTDLRKRLEGEFASDTPSTVFYCPLSTALGPIAAQECINWWRTNDMQDVPYDILQLIQFQWWLWWNSWTPKFLHCKPPRPLFGVVCSVAVARAAIAAGIVPSDLDPNGQTPRDVMAWPQLDPAILIQP